MTNALVGAVEVNSVKSSGETEAEHNWIQVCLDQYSHNFHKFSAVN